MSTVVIRLARTRGTSQDGRIPMPLVVGDRKTPRATRQPSVVTETILARVLAAAGGQTVQPARGVGGVVVEAEDGAAVVLAVVVSVDNGGKAEKVAQRLGVFECQ